MTTLTPTAVYHAWFPAVVTLPDGRTLHKTKTYATDAGLIVYALTVPAGSALASAPTVVFESPILLDKTTEPATDYASRKRGYTLVTEAGKVSVLQGGSCACGMRSLKAFTPSWAAVEKTWGA